MVADNAHPHIASVSFMLTGVAMLLPTVNVGKLSVDEAEATVTPTVQDRDPVKPWVGLAIVGPTINATRAIMPKSTYFFM
jgi:hypothetical protein